MSQETNKKSQRIAFLVASAFFMENFDATVIATALPAMAKTFATAPTALSVGVSAYLLALAVFIPISGWVADRFGPRQVFATAIVVFTTASVACGLAQSLPMFVAARILQGIGGALMVPVGRMVVLRTTPREGIVRAIATITWPGLAAPLLGPPLGGWIASTFSWHWIFFINLPLGAVATVLALRWIDGAPGGARPFDWTGFIASGAGLAAVMVAVDGVTQPGADLARMAAIGAAGVALLGFSVWHMRRAAHPLLNLSVFSVRTFRASAIGGSLSRISISSAPFLLPLMFQLGFGFGMVQSGLLMLALFAGNLGIKPATTWVLRRFGFRSTLVGNGLLAAAGFAACAFLSADTPLALMVVVLVFGGMTRSMQFTAVGTLAFADTSKDQAGGASTLFSMFQQLSAGLGIALGALALRLAQLFSGHVGEPTAPDFRFALLVMGLLTVLSLLDAWRLPANAGERVSGHRSAGAAP
jgi:EmrB/QacA subfamily drug resistance transporter